MSSKIDPSVKTPSSELPNDPPLAAPPRPRRVVALREPEWIAPAEKKAPPPLGPAALHAEDVPEFLRGVSKAIVDLQAFAKRQNPGESAYRKQVETFDETVKKAARILAAHPTSARAVADSARALFDIAGSSIAAFDAVPATAEHNLRVVALAHLGRLFAELRQQREPLEGAAEIEGMITELRWAAEEGRRDSGFHAVVIAQLAEAFLRYRPADTADFAEIIKGDLQRMPNAPPFIVGALGDLSHALLTGSAALSAWHARYAQSIDDAPMMDSERVAVKTLMSSVSSTSSASAWSNSHF